MAVEETADGFRSRLLQMRQRGPALQEIGRQCCKKFLSHHCQCLGESVFDRLTQTVAQGGAKLDKAAAGLDQRLKFPRGGVQEMVRAQLMAVSAHQFHQKHGVGGIALAQARREGLAEARESGRIDSEDDQMRTLSELIHQWPAGLFEGDGDGFAAIALADSFQPGANGGRRAREDELFGCVGSGIPQADRVRGVCPVDADHRTVGGVGCVRVRHNIGGFDLMRPAPAGTRCLLP